MEEDFCSISILADREARPHFPSEKMSLARLERDAKASFSIHITWNVGTHIHARKKSELACYEYRQISIQVSHNLSRYGDSLFLFLESYPRYYPRSPARPCGLHRFEPVLRNAITRALGNVTYPTRNFAWALLEFLLARECFLHILRCMSPCSPDYIFNQISQSCLAFSLWGFSRIQREPFLLIVRTDEIITLSRTLGFTDFPANGQILLRQL